MQFHSFNLLSRTRYKLLHSYIGFFPSHVSNPITTPRYKLNFHLYTYHFHVLDCLSTLLHKNSRQTIYSCLSHFFSFLCQDCHYILLGRQYFVDSTFPFYLHQELGFIANQGFGCPYFPSFCSFSFEFLQV